MELRRDLELELDPELVWELLTRPEELASWLGDEVDLEPVPGAAGRVVDQDGTVRRLVVGEVDHGRRLSWDWWEEGDGNISNVELTVAPSDHGTLVRVVEVPRPGAAASVQASSGPRALAASARRWNRVLADLELLVLLRSPVLVRA